MKVRILVLGLLADAPAHGYEIKKWLEISRTDLWANVLAGSIYHALRQMEKQELITIRETSQDGHRMRAIYEITAKGRLELVNLLQKGWRTIPKSFPEELYTLLTFSHKLDDADVRTAMDKMISGLEKMMEVFDEGEKAKTSYPDAPAWTRAIFENSRAHIGADIALLRTLRKTWPV